MCVCVIERVREKIKEKERKTTRQINSEEGRS